MFDCGIVIPPDIVELTRKNVREKLSQDGQVVDVVSVALRQGKSADDDMME